jgi:hypothetical protein
VGEAGAALGTSVRKRGQECEKSAREATGGDQNQHKRETVWAANSKSMGQSFPRHLGLTSCLCVPQMQDVDLSV